MDWTANFFFNYVFIKIIKFNSFKTKTFLRTTNLSPPYPLGSIQKGDLFHIRLCKIKQSRGLSVIFSWAGIRLFHIHFFFQLSCIIFLTLLNSSLRLKALPGMIGAPVGGGPVGGGPDTVGPEGLCCWRFTNGCFCWVLEGLWLLWWPLFVFP